MNGMNFQFGPTTEQLAVSLSIIEDMLVEGEESLMLSLTSPTVDGQLHPGVQLGTQQNTQILIEDNDGKLDHIKTMVVTCNNQVIAYCVTRSSYSSIVHCIPTLLTR